jgi:hypothetical protein
MPPNSMSMGFDFQNPDSHASCVEVSSTSIMVAPDDMTVCARRACSFGPSRLPLLPASSSLRSLHSLVALSFTQN